MTASSSARWEQIFPELLAAIRSAQRTITFENFLWKEGQRAGVKVHFLLDALSCDDVHGRALNLVRRSPVELEIFRFMNLVMNFRTYRKLLVIDGHTGYIGGTGIADTWKGNGPTRARLTL